MRTISRFFATFILLMIILAGCDVPQTSPTETQQSEVSKPATPSSILGTTPTNSLLGGTPTIRHNAAGARLDVEIDINKGILNASQTGNANFALRTTLRLTNLGGQSIVVVGSCPLADVKLELADPRPHPFLLVGYTVPWDGNDANGEPMAGDLMADYLIELVLIGTNQTRLIESRTGSVLVGGSSELIGTTPTSNLLGVTGIEYVAGQGFEVGFEINHGLFTAAQTGEAPFALQVELTVTGTGGNEIIVIGGCPLSDVKVDLAPEPGQPVQFRLSVPWDGTDTGGNAMTGNARVSYDTRLGVVVTKGDDIVQLMGFFDVFLGGGNLQ